MRPHGSGHGKNEEAFQEARCAVLAGSGQEHPRGSGLEKQVRPSLQLECGSGPGQTPPCIPGLRTNKDVSPRGAFSENSCATPPLVNEMNDWGYPLPCASRRGAAGCPGGATGRPGGRVEDHSQILVHCTGVGDVITVNWKKLVGFEDEPEVEEIVDDVSGWSKHCSQRTLSPGKLSGLKEIEGENKGMGQGNATERCYEDAGSKAEIEHAIPDVDHMGTQAGQLVENKEMLKLAVESGVVFYDDEEDLMEILQS
ncbi:uncharacterized protein [Arachis hypogaea]|uniref:uncharacterized protein n=1 Tax=Arachis hypogaea TaxID=3818 RepID=UPI003B2269C9